MRELRRGGGNIFVIEAKKCVNYATPVRPAGGCGCLVVARRSRYYLFIDNAAKILQQTEHSSRQQPAPVTFKLIIQGQIIAGERCRSHTSQMPIVSQSFIQLQSSQNSFFLQLLKYFPIQSCLALTISKVSDNWELAWKCTSTFHRMLLLKC